IGGEGASHESWTARGPGEGQRLAELLGEEGGDLVFEAFAGAFGEGGIFWGGAHPQPLGVDRLEGARPSGGSWRRAWGAGRAGGPIGAGGGTPCAGAATVIAAIAAEPMSISRTVAARVRIVARPSLSDATGLRSFDLVALVFVLRRSATRDRTIGASAQIDKD